MNRAKKLSLRVAHVVHKKRFYAADVYLSVGIGFDVLRAFSEIPGGFPSDSIDSEF